MAPLTIIANVVLVVVMGGLVLIQMRLQWDLLCGLRREATAWANIIPLGEAAYKEDLKGVQTSLGKLAWAMEREYEWEDDHRWNIWRPWKMPPPIQSAELPEPVSN